MPHDEYAKMVLEIDDEGENLTDWEKDFINRMMTHIHLSSPLHPYQKTIKEIYDKRVK